MRTCKKCGVKVRGTETFCPLCQHRLLGEPEEAVYPEIPTVYRQHELLFKCLILISVAVGVICAAVNLLVPGGGFWSFFVALGILCFWVSLAYAARKRDNIPQNITAQVFLVSVLSFGWDCLTGWHGWSLDYVIPIACGTAMLSLFILAKVMKLPPEEYILYFMVDILFGVVPLVFYLAGLIHVAVPSVVCISLSFFSLSALLVFEGKAMLRELTRRFHV